MRNISLLFSIEHPTPTPSNQHIIQFLQYRSLPISFPLNNRSRFKIDHNLYFSTYLAKNEHVFETWERDCYQEKIHCPLKACFLSLFDQFGGCHLGTNLIWYILNFFMKNLYWNIQMMRRDTFWPNKWCATLFGLTHNTWVTLFGLFYTLYLHISWY